MLLCLLPAGEKKRKASLPVSQAAPIVFVFSSLFEMTAACDAPPQFLRSRFCHTQHIMQPPGQARGNRPFALNTDDRLTGAIADIKILVP